MGKTVRKILYILGQLNDADVDWLAKSGKRRRISTGTPLLTEGVPTNCLYILLDGTASVAVKGLGEVAEVGCGEIMGEMSFLDAKPPAATVTALRDCVLFELSAADLLRKLNEDDGFSARFHRAISRFLSERLRAVYRRTASRQAAASDEEEEDELDLDLLGDIHLAGARFDGMLKKLMDI